MKHNFDGTAVNDNIFDQFYAQRSRGTQGFGLFDGQEMNMVKTASEEKIVKWLAKYKSNLIMFHHRFPTSTINVKRAAHPFSTGNYFGKTQYVMVHNGCLRNQDELFTAHKKRGIKYTTLLADNTFNDSESLLWDFALTLEGRQKEMAAIGDMAIIVLKIEDGVLEKMYFGRKGRPLHLFRDKETIELSSEGRGEDIAEDKLFTWSYKYNRLTSKDMTFTQYRSYANNNVCGYNGWSNDYEDYDEYGWRKDDQLKLGASLGRAIAEQYGELDLTPTEEQVQAKTIRYLMAVNGHFEQAYWALEADYCETFEWGDDEEQKREQLLLERCMEFLALDPEYLDEESVSTLWGGGLWPTQKAF